MLKSKLKTIITEATMNKYTYSIGSVILSLVVALSILFINSKPVTEKVESSTTINTTTTFEYTTETKTTIASTKITLHMIEPTETTVSQIKVDEEEQEEETTIKDEVLIEEEQESENIISYDCDYLYSGSQFCSMGVIYWNGYRWTWYSQNELSGGGLSIPGRHVDGEDYVCDENGYICLASNDLSYGTVIPTPFGKYGKIYDCGCASGTIDVYTNF